MKRAVALAPLLALALLCGTALGSPAAHFRHAETRFGSWRARDCGAYGGTRR